MSWDKYSTRPKAPFNRSGTDFGVRLFDATTTSQANAMPADWDHCMVELFADGAGGNVHYAFSTNASAAVDFTLAGSAAGASAAAGGVLVAGVPKTVFLPKLSPGETLYFVRDAGGTTSVRITKLSERI